MQLDSLFLVLTYSAIKRNIFLGLFSTEETSGAETLKTVDQGLLWSHEPFPGVPLFYFFFNLIRLAQAE